MAITQSLCTTFRAQLMLAVHDFRPSAQGGASIFKLALYTSSAELTADTTAYTATGESSGANYTAGGVALTNLGSSSTSGGAYSGVGYCDFADLTFSNVTLTARAALIYNSTPKANDNTNAALTNPAVCILDFGNDKVAAAGDFTITFPAGNSTNAIIRIS